MKRPVLPARALARTTVPNLLAAPMRVPLNPAARKTLPMSQSIDLRPRQSRRRQIAELVSLVVSWVLVLRLNSTLWNWLLFDVLKLDRHKKVPDVVHFFFYDSTKIALLLVGITFAVTIARSFVTIDRTRAFLGGKRAGLGNIFAASL